jgi:hypothetical protein
MKAVAKLDNIDPISGKDIRSRFLIRAVNIMEQYIDDAVNDDPGHRTQRNGAQAKIFDALIPIIQSSGDIQKIEAESAQDVIALIKDGLVTFSEARDLMQMLSTKSDIEDMKVLLEKMEALGGD